LPDMPGIPMRIEAASLRGQPVSFMVVYPWTTPVMRPLSSSIMISWAFIMTSWALTLILVTLMAAASIFAHQNLRLGRGDRRGAARLVASILTVFSITWILSEHHVAALEEIGVLVRFISYALFTGGFLLVLYIGLEPFVRRRWPQLLTSWT